jgi:hypothetical protein
MEERIQKIAVIDVNAQTENTIRGYLNNGYVIHHIVPITVGSVQRLIIVYYQPE